MENSKQSVQTNPKDQTKQSPSPDAVSDKEVKWAREIIDGALFPSIKKQIGILNETLAKKNIQAGIEITWYFDRPPVKKGD